MDSGSHDNEALWLTAARVTYTVLLFWARGKSCEIEEVGYREGGDENLTNTFHNWFCPPSVVVVP